MARFFTLTQAEALLPRLERLLKVAVSAKSEASELDEALQSVLMRIQVSGGMEVDPSSVAEMKLLRRRALQQAQDAVGDIHDTGCVVKDLDMGLLDFPAMLGNQEVYLCWRLGESRISYWHGVDEGFGGRKPIDERFGGEGSSGLRPN